MREAVHRVRALWWLPSLVLPLSACTPAAYKAPPLPVFMQESTHAAGRPVQAGPTATGPTPGMAPAPARPGDETSQRPRVSPPPSRDAVRRTAPQTSGLAAEPKFEKASGSYSLDQAIRRALEADPQIAAGLESIAQAEADLVTAGLLPNPELASDLLMMPWGKPFTVEKQGGPPQTDHFVGFPVDWFIFGKRAAAIVTAQKGVDVATAQFADLIRQRIASTIGAFYDVLEAEAQLDLAKVDLESLSQLEQITATRVELGGVGAIELDRVKLVIFSAQREVRTREMLLASALARLRAFLGFAEDVPLHLNGTLDVAEPAAPLSVEAAFQLAAENRPDLIALQRQIEMAEAGVALEERRAWPEVKPAFGFTRQFQKEYFDFPDANSWNVALAMSMPVFDRNQGNIAKARSVKTQAELNRHAQLIELRAEIVHALKSFEAARAALLIDDPGQLEAAQSVRDKIRAAYELGGKPLIDVLDSQRAYRETFRLHIASRSTYWHSLYALNAAVGRQVLK